MLSSRPPRVVLPCNTYRSRIHVKRLNLLSNFAGLTEDMLVAFSLSYVMVCLLLWLTKEKFLSTLQETGLEISGEAEISSQKFLLTTEISKPNL